MIAQDRIRADFDEIARLTDDGASGTDRYEKLLLSLVPADAARVLDVGCGRGGLTRAIARGSRQVVGIDLSPEMIQRARGAGLCDVTFVVGDFLSVDVDRSFDCVLSAAALHHMDADAALRRMIALLRPGGRLILHDLRRNVTAGESLRATIAFAHAKTERLIRTGQVLPPRRVRQAWSRHGAGETYLSGTEAHAMADRHLPGATLFNHWLWRYTIVWDKPERV